VAQATLSIDQAKERALLLYAAGASVEKAMAASGRALRTWESWRKSDKHFAAQADTVRTERRRKSSAVGDSVDVPPRRDMSFAQWRKEYLDFDTYPHQQQWIDVLEGNEPVPIEGCEWDPRDTNRLVINVPPGFAKTQTVTIDYATYRICMNPNVRIIVVSKRVEQAQKFLYQIQQRLTSSRFTKLQAAFAPPGGFKPGRGEGSFASRVMYVAGRTVDHKDPTLEALGMGSQIYGSRADLIILDDCIVLANANEWEKQVNWLESEVESRVKNGKIVAIGTRLASQDLYSELRNDERYLSGRSPWSYLRQPAVLQFAENAEDWVTLWPKSTTAYDEADKEADDRGLYTMFDGPRCAKIRDSKPPAVWSLVYQQQQTAEDAAFKPLCVMSSVDRRRKPGPLTAGAWGHPRRGGEGMWTIASMDPAMAGDTFTIVGKVDRTDQKRWIENCFVQGSPSPEYFRDLIRRVTLEYGVNEWVIEEQGFQGFLVHDPEIRAFLATRGVRMTGHYTGKNKLDPDFGVASLSALFGTVRRINDGAGREVFVAGSNLIQLPDPDMSQGVKSLIEELLTWVPGRRGSKLRQDGPMALWFFETRARIILGHDRQGGEQKFVNLPFMSRGTAAKRAVAPVGFLSRRVVG
jgi:hypothetical protein